MQHFSDLAIILKTFQFQERDRAAVFLTAQHGRVTGLAKGGVSSKRFGGTLDFLACSKIHWVQKPTAEMVRIDSAEVHHEFKNLGRDFTKFSLASLAAELFLCVLEGSSPSHEAFVLFSNFLFQLDEGSASNELLFCTFLAKLFKILGYPPSFLRCVQCHRGAHEVPEPYLWSSKFGGIVCADCTTQTAASEQVLSAEVLLLFQHCTVTKFKDLVAARLEDGAREQLGLLQRLLLDFLYHHVPGLPPQGLNSARVLGL